MKRTFILRAAIMLLLVTTTMAAWAQTYSVSYDCTDSDGYTCKPNPGNGTYYVTTPSGDKWLAYTTSTPTTWIRAKAIIINNTSIYFFAYKNSGTFNNGIIMQVRKDVKISNGKVTNAGTVVKSATGSAGSQGAALSLDPDFTSGTHTYTITLISGSYTFYTTPIRVSAETPESPNLTIINTDYFGNTNLTLNTEYDYSVRVKNTGSSSWTGRFYLKSNGNNLIAWETPRTIDPGKSAYISGSYAFTSTGTKSVGLYYKTETETNGDLVKPGDFSNPFNVTVTSNLVLASTGSFGTTTLTKGTPYKFSVKVKNIGSSSWSGAFYLKYGTGDTNWLKWSKTIGAGQTETLEDTYTPKTTGNYTLTLYYQTGGTGEGSPVPQGSYSNPITVTVVAPLDTPDNSTFGVVSGSITTNSFTAKWGAVSGATKYNINVKKASDSEYNSSTIVCSKKGITSTSCNVTGLEPGTSYHFQIQAANNNGQTSSWSSSIPTPITTLSSSIDDMTAAQAAEYLQGKGVLVSGDPRLNEELSRQQLAKVAFRGLYSISGRSVNDPIPSDNYPTAYSDIGNSYAFQEIRALLYLEYDDGITPFDRNRLKFDPENTIARVDVLKVLLEAFDIKPNSNLTNPFPNDQQVSDMKSNGNFKYGYIAKAANFGIVKKPSNGQNEEFHPYTFCTRGQAFLMLARIMKKIEAGMSPNTMNMKKAEAGNITDPNPGTTDYFEPLNVTLATISLGLGLPLGNFQHYTKTSFDINGTVPLTFAHAYNSYNTTLQEEFFGANGDDETYQPLGDGWSHSYHTFITEVDDDYLIVHWGGGSIDVYKKNGSDYIPLSIGVYDQLTNSGSTYVIKTRTQISYYFETKANGVSYLSRIVDRNDNTLTINYQNGLNGFKRISSVSSVSDGQRSLNFSYDIIGTNLLTSVSDPLGRSIQFGYELNEYTGRYQLASFTDAKNQKTTYIYGNESKTSKLLTKVQLPKGNYINNQYDYNRRLTQTDNGTSKTTVKITPTYGSYGASVSTTSTVKITRNGSGTSTYNYAFNGNNVVTNMSGPKNLSMSSTYDNNLHPELPTSITTNSTNISNVTYDDKGNVKQIDVTGDGKTLTTTMTYDPMNNLTSVTDPKDNETTYTYDSKGNLTKVSAPEGVTTNIVVNSQGLPTTVTNPMNVVTQYEYNSYGNLTKTILPALGLSSSAEYDAASRLISSTDALGRTTSFTYDNNDNLISEKDPDNHPTRYDYDANDNLIKITNANGGVTSMSYDNATDWLTSVSFAGNTRKYDYNQDGTLKTFTKPDDTTLSYSYDDLGRVVDDGVNTYTYDSQTLNLKSVKDKTSGKTLTYTYDGFNRITGTSYDGHSNTYTYDANGNCLSINNTTYTYDGLNRLTTVKFNGKTITYYYRKDSQLWKVSYPNGMTTEYGYDAVGRLTSKNTKLSNGTVVASYTYTLDKVGNIKSQTTTEPYGNIVLENEDISYTYDSGNRITKRITQAGDISFSFDKNGNTTKRGDKSYSWDVSDRLTKAGSSSITYDPLGLITSYGNITFTTDPLGIGNGFSSKKNGAEYLQETALENGENFLLDSLRIGNVLSDSKSGAQYIYGYGLEARVIGNKVSYYVTDFRGSVVAIVDENGNITHKYQYDEFGKVTQKDEADYNPFQYVGKYGVMALNDHLYYMRARHYDPTTGRFLSEDPIWSPNLYPYADNNPIMGIDPKGDLVLITAGIGAVLVGAMGAVFSYGYATATVVTAIVGGAAVGAIGGGIWGYGLSKKPKPRTTNCNGSLRGC